MKRQEDRKILEAKSKKKKKDYDKEMQESVSIMLVKLFFPSQKHIPHMFRRCHTKYLIEHLKSLPPPPPYSLVCLLLLVGLGYMDETWVNP